MLRNWFIAVGLLALLGGCQTMPQSTLPQGAIYHFVAIWLQDPSDVNARQRIAQQTETWRTYPGVLDVAYGDGLPDERTVVQDYDYGVLIIFQNDAALRAYEADPEHQQAIRNVLGPVSSQVMVYDFQVPEGTLGGVERSELRNRQYRRYQEFSN